MRRSCPENDAQVGGAKALETLVEFVRALQCSLQEAERALRGADMTGGTMDDAALLV